MNTSTAEAQSAALEKGRREQRTTRLEQILAEERRMLDFESTYRANHRYRLVVRIPQNASAVR